MAFQLCLILLVTAVLAENHGRQGGSISTGNPLEKYFHWGPVDDHSVSLTWQKEKLTEYLEANLTMVAVWQADPRFIASVCALLFQGGVQLDELMPSSRYTVTVTVVKNGSLILKIIKEIHTQEVDPKVLQKLFKWGPVTSHSIGLSWELKNQSETMEGRINMTAALVSHPEDKRSASVDVNQGNATIDGLMPNSPYEVTVVGSFWGLEIFKFSKEIKTLGTGRGFAAKISGLVVVFFTCMTAVFA